MFSWRDVIVAQEHNKDLLREAEEQRLIQQAMAGRYEFALWKKVKEAFSKFTQTNSATKEGACATCPSTTDLAI